MSEIAKKLIKNQENLKSTRSNYDSVNQDITDYVLPNRGNFTREKTPGEDITNIIFDSTAITAAQDLAAILANGLTDPRMVWAKLRAKDKEIDKQEDVRRYLEEVEEVLADVFSSGESGFALENHQLLLDLVGYGTAVMFVGEEKDNVLFQTRHLSEIWIEENNFGFVDTVYRMFQMTARQALQEWGEDKIGDKIKGNLDSDPFKKFDFLNVVMPMVDYERLVTTVEKRLQGFDYVSLNIGKDDSNILSVKGFHEMPYIVVRWVKRAGEVYGVSPSWNAISDILTINAMAEIGLKSAQKQVDPPILVSDDGVIMPMQTFPGGVNVGGLNDDGEEMMKPFVTGQNNSMLGEVLARLEDKIEKAYFVDQFRDREGVQPLTATESMHRQQNKMLLIAPQTKRIEDEYLTKMIVRVLSILGRNGKLPENIPAALIKNGSIEYTVEYAGPLGHMQQSNQLLAYNRFFANVGTFVELKPDVMQNFDIDAIIRDGAEKSGIPLKMLKTSEQVSNQRAAEAQAMAEEQAKSDLVDGADVASKLAKAGIPIQP